jgi:hypothetical protein
MELQQVCNILVSHHNLYPHAFYLCALPGKDGKRSKKQYRRDQTERRQKRIERSKAKGASKDVWGLRREG